MAGFVAPVIAVILGAVVVVVFAVNAVVVRREDRHYSLIGVAPDGLSRHMRRLNGAHSRYHNAEPRVGQPLARI